MIKLGFTLLILMTMNFSQFAWSCECMGRSLNHEPTRSARGLAATYGQDTKLTPLMMGLYDAKMAIDDLRCVTPINDLAKLGPLLKYIEQTQKALARGELPSQPEVRNSLSLINRELPLLITELERQTNIVIFSNYFLAHYANVTAFLHQIK